MEENSPLIDIHPYHLSYIFGFLRPDDLLELALTCSAMKSSVYEFCSTKSNPDLPMIENFFKNESCLSPKEVSLKNTLQKYQSPLMIHKLSKYYKMRVRVSCTDVDFFPHSTNPAYFDISVDDNLKHNVVSLQSVCWLEIKHCFKAVKPGKYKAAMRMKFDENFRWPANHSTVVLKVSWKDDEDDACENFNEGIFKSSDWVKIKAMVEEGGKPFKGFPSNCNLTNYNKNLGWFDFELSDEIAIDKETDLAFIFQDVINGSWKSGVAFDYIELIPFI